MAERKRRIVKTPTPETPAVTMPDIKVSTRTEGVALQNTIIRVKPAEDSAFIGAIMAGEKVDILDSSLYMEGWLKIKTRATLVEGYVNSRSIL